MYGDRTDVECYMRDPWMGERMPHAHCSWSCTLHACLEHPLKHAQTNKV